MALANLSFKEEGEERAALWRLASEHVALIKLGAHSTAVEAWDERGAASENPPIRVLIDSNVPVDPAAPDGPTRREFWAAGLKLPVHKRTVQASLQWPRNADVVNRIADALAAPELTDRLKRLNRDARAITDAYRNGAWDTGTVGQALDAADGNVLIIHGEEGAGARGFVEGLIVEHADRWALRPEGEDTGAAGPWDWIDVRGREPATHATVTEVLTTLAINHSLPTDADSLQENVRRHLLLHPTVVVLVDVGPELDNLRGIFHNLPGRSLVIMTTHDTPSGPGVVRYEPDVKRLHGIVSEAVDSSPAAGLDQDTIDLLVDAAQRNCFAADVIRGLLTITPVVSTPRSSANRTIQVLRDARDAIALNDGVAIADIPGVADRPGTTIELMVKLAVATVAETFTIGGPASRNDRDGVDVVDTPTVLALLRLFTLSPSRRITPEQLLIAADADPGDALNLANAAALIRAIAKTGLVVLDDVARASGVVVRLVREAAGRLLTGPTTTRQREAVEAITTNLREAVIDDIVSKANVMTLPVAPWPFEADRSLRNAPTGWLDQRIGGEDSYGRVLTDAIDIASRLADAKQLDAAAKVALSIVGHLDRSNEWAHLEHVTRTVSHAIVADDSIPLSETTFSMLLVAAWAEAKVNRRFETAATGATSPPTTAQGWLQLARNRIADLPDDWRTTAQLWIDATHLKVIYDVNRATVQHEGDTVKALTAQIQAASTEKRDGVAKLELARARAFAAVQVMRFHRRTIGGYIPAEEADGAATADNGDPTGTLADLVDAAIDRAIQISGYLDTETVGEAFANVKEALDTAAGAWAAGGDGLGIAYAHLHRSRLYRLTGRLTDALREAATATEAFNALGHRRGAAASLNQQARIWRYQGHYTRALDSLETARVTHHDNRSIEAAATDRLLVQTLLEGGQLTPPEAHPERVSGPERTQDLINWARIAFDTGNYEVADQKFNEALIYADDDIDGANQAEVRHHRAVLHVTLGRSDAAIKDISEALDLYLARVSHPYKFIATLANAAYVIWQLDRTDRPNRTDALRLLDAAQGLLDKLVQPAVDGVGLPHSQLVIGLRRARYLVRSAWNDDPDRRGRALAEAEEILKRLQRVRNTSGLVKFDRLLDLTYFDHQTLTDRLHGPMGLAQVQARRRQLEEIAELHADSPPAYIVAVQHRLLHAYETDFECVPGQFLDAHNVTIEKIRALCDGDYRPHLPRCLR